MLFYKQLWTEQLNNSTEGFLEVPVSTDLAHLTLDIIGRCAFGYHFNTVLSGETETSSAFSAVIQDISFGRVMRKRYIPLYDYLPLAENERARKALEITDGTVLEVSSQPIQIHCMCKFCFSWNSFLYLL